MPEIERKISWANIITIGLIIIGGLGSWYTTSAQVANNKSAISDIASSLKNERAARTSAASSTDARIRALELTMARTDERFNAVMAGLSRIENKLEQLERRQSQ